MEWTAPRIWEAWISKRSASSIAFPLSKGRLVLSLSHLNRVQSPIINHARQDLASQFPEAALVRSVRSGKKVPLLWGWLCSQRQSVKYDLMLDRSIGLGITDERKPARCADLWYSAGRDGARISTFERYSNRLGGYGVNWEWSLLLRSDPLRGLR